MGLSQLLSPEACFVPQNAPESISAAQGFASNPTRRADSAPRDPQVMVFGRVAWRQKGIKRGKRTRRLN